MTLHFRGQRVLRAVLQHLVKHHGLGSATHVLFGGGSAGGLATFLGADRVGKLLRGWGAPLKKFRALPVSGWFLDHPVDPQAPSGWRTWVKQPNGWAYHAGAVPAGSDVVPPNRTSYSDAIATCRALSKCLAITFKDPNTTKPASATKIYYKSTAQFSPDAGSSAGQLAFGESMQAMAKLHNTTGGVPAACVASLPPDQQWRCVLANYSYAFSKTPMFPLQSSVDLYQLFAIARLGGWDAGCLNRGIQFKNCSASQLANIKEYARSFMADLTRSAKYGKKGEGGFVTSCLEHVAAQSSAFFDNYTIGSLSEQAALTAWWLADGTEPAAKHWSLPCTLGDAAPHQCNPSCYPGHIK